MLLSRCETVRQHLRAETAAAHARLDAASSTLRLETVAGYRRFLAAHAAVVPPLERALEEAGVVRLLPDWPARRRRSVLADDLHSLSIASETIAPPSLSGDAALMGAAYVLEGSRLGARIILQRILPGIPAHYLRQGDGEDLWRSFLMQLESCEAVRSHPQDTADAARAVFSLFEIAITRQCATNKMAAA